MKFANQIKPIEKFHSLSRRNKFVGLLVVLFLLSFSFVFHRYLLPSFASGGNPIAFETESGTTSGAVSVITDASASAGQAIQFNQALAAVQQKAALKAVAGASTSLYTAGGSVLAQDTFAGRTVSNGWGTASDGNAWSVQIGSAANFSVGTNEGKLKGATVSFATLGTTSATDEEGVVRFSTGNTSDDDGRIVLRFSSTSNYYAAGLAAPNGTPEVDIFSNKAGTSTSVASTAFAAVNNTFYWQRVRVQTSGSQAVISARIWADGTNEPTTWNVTYTDSSPLPAGKVGLDGYDGGLGWNVDSFSAGDLSGNTPSNSPTPFPSATATPGITLSPTVSASPSPTTSCANVPTSTASVTNTVNVTASGDYYVWTRMLAQSSASNGYYLQVDSTCPVTVGGAATMPTNSWTWVNYVDGNSASPVLVNLTAGTHTMRLIEKEVSVALDRVILTQDQSCVPTGTGDNCVSVAVPTVTPTPPSGALQSFSIQSSSVANQSGSTISTPGFSTSGWYPVGPRSTVYAGLVANKVYPDPFYSTNMKTASGDFGSPWWYRSDFTLDSASGLNTFVDFSGIISSADVWVNGTQVASHTQVAGAYTNWEFNLSSLVHSGTNSIAFEIYPNDAYSDFTLGWIDWNPTPPDNNMGMFRDVSIRRTGVIALQKPHVISTVASNLSSAQVTVKVDAKNNSSSAVSTTISGTIGSIAFSQPVTVAANSTQTVTFTPSSYSQLSIANPQLWWPVGMGPHTLYTLSLTSTVGSTTSDTTDERFGLRLLNSTVDASNIRHYSINNHPVLIRGAGWGEDLLLRSDPTSLATKMRYIVDLGLNAIRFEGHLDTSTVYDLADQYGVMLLPGWECCNKWQNSTWSGSDQTIAQASMVSEADRLRDHPSVISFLIGSDNPPSSAQQSVYNAALKAEDWPNPVIDDVNDFSSVGTNGPTGFKESGPYEWIPPVYWYNKVTNGGHGETGGAFGFNTETSAGPDIPTLDSLKRMLSATELNTLWQNPTAVQYHAGDSADFNNLSIYNSALSGRYGAPVSLTDYVAKSQLANYEATRAQFEAYARNFTDASLPSTGLIYWLLTPGWSSLHWQLFDAYFDQGGSYYGTKKANESVHIQYSNDDGSVVVVNRTLATVNGLSARASVYNLDGTQKYDTTVSNLSVPGDGGNTRPITIPSAITGLNATYLVRLILTDSSGNQISRNTYWLSTKADVMDYNQTDYRYTKTTSYGDLTGLSSLAQTPVSAVASSVTDANGLITTTVTVQNSSAQPTPAFYVDLHVTGANGAPVLPVQWSDNELSLWPGEAQTVTVSYASSDLNGATPMIRISGWNVPTQSISATGGGVLPTAVPTVTPAPTATGAPTATPTLTPVPTTKPTPTSTPKPTPTTALTPTATPLPGGKPLAGGTIFAQDTFLGRTASSGWGTASDGSTWTVQSGTASLLSVGVNEGKITGAANGSSPTEYLTIGSTSVSDAEAVVRYATSNFKSDDGRIILRHSNTSNYYLVGLASPTNTAEVDIYRYKAGTMTRLTGAAMTVTNSAFYWERARVTTLGTSAVISVRVWKDGTTEPTTWNVTYTDSSPVPAGKVGLNAWDGGANWSVDHFSAGKL